MIRRRVIVNQEIIEKWLEEPVKRKKVRSDKMGVLPFAIGIQLVLKKIGIDENIFD